MSKFQVTEVQEVTSTHFYVYEVEAESQEEAVDFVRYGQAEGAFLTGTTGDSDYGDWQGFGADLTAAKEDAAR